MMQHYLGMKEEYADCILFYRLGDFYEMFFDDAKLVSRELELTLTGKDCGLEERAPMCGVPFHAAETYIGRLVEKGYKVAIAEQVEDPKKAKGLVKREVIRIVTPGTITSDSALEGDRNLYIACVSANVSRAQGRAAANAQARAVYGLAFCDLSTGDLFAASLRSKAQLSDELLKYDPAEILVPEQILGDSELFDADTVLEAGKCLTGRAAHEYSEGTVTDVLKRHFHVGSLEGLGISSEPEIAAACGALLAYLYETQKNSLSHITNLRVYESSGCMLLDHAARRNLELTETLRDKKKRGSLLWVLDKTKTAMGARLLRSWIERPLVDRDAILERQDAVEELNADPVTREELAEYLGPVYDLERLMGKISTRSANPRDLAAFRQSLEPVPAIRALLADARGSLLAHLYADMDPLTDLCSLIGEAIVEDPPFAVKEGGIIRPGFSEEADTLRSASTDGKKWLAELEAEEKERTGIKNLRIRYNRVFGYYLEVTNSFLDMVPDDYIRKQTLTTAERFTTPRLKELENIILGADEKLSALEYELFCQIRDRIAGEVLRIQKTARALAALDALISLGKTAEQNGYVRPDINAEGRIVIKDGRHPIVEKMLPDGAFIPNDAYLDGGDSRMSIITGPNMAGKSTYMRQTALIVLMAQIGSFVPASKADIAICDRVFTRVGASDDLGSGQSTFMVEMSEVANILRNAGPDSLIILDEIGRGTSTFDGLSIAWAVLEYIADRAEIGAKTLFATHYHELTQLEGMLDGVRNFSVAVRESGEDIVFLRKIVEGGADQSYGIQVAKLAGVPKSVTDRASEILAELDKADLTRHAKALVETEGQLTFDFIAPKIAKKAKTAPAPAEGNGKGEELLKALGELQPDNMTPMDALNLLYEWKKRF